MDTSDVVYFICICGHRIEHNYEKFIKCAKCSSTYELEVSERYNIKSYILPKAANRRNQEDYIKVTRRGWEPKNEQRGAKEDITKSS